VPQLRQVWDRGAGRRHDMDIDIASSEYDGKHGTATKRMIVRRHDRDAVQMFLFQNPPHCDGLIHRVPHTGTTSVQGIALLNTPGIEQRRNKPRRIAPLD